MAQDDDPTLVEQSSEAAANMAEVVEISQKIWSLFLSAQAEDGLPRNADPLNTMPAWLALGKAMYENPKDIADATLQLWASQAALWQAASLRWMGAKDQALPELPHRAQAGKRFAHKDWSENALFDYLKESYLLTS
ncbi:MAG: hypothetical protein AAGE38_05335, partial [Pseudomonadota bacterium]